MGWRLRPTNRSRFRSKCGTDQPKTTLTNRNDTVGYRTSYSHAGRYSTLTRIPAFDARGVWVFRDVRFSVRGTLRATVERLVTQAPAGHTHGELEALVGLRVHDPLRSLVHARRLARARLGAWEFGGAAARPAESGDSQAKW